MIVERIGKPPAILHWLAVHKDIDVLAQGSIVIDEIPAQPREAGVKSTNQLGDISCLNLERRLLRKSREEPMQVVGEGNANHETLRRGSIRLTTIPLTERLVVQLSLRLGRAYPATAASGTAATKRC